MKKKMAILMASIMALSPVSAFAATSNRIDGTITTTKKKTVLMEKTWMNKDGSPNGRDIFTLVKPDKNDDIEFVVQGSDLIIAANTDQIKAGDTFTITLNNAEWAFANANGTPGTPDADRSASINPSTISKFEDNVAALYLALVTTSRDNQGTPPADPFKPGTPPASGLDDDNPNSYTAAEWTTVYPASQTDAKAIWAYAEQTMLDAYNATPGISVADRTSLLLSLGQHSNTVGYDEATTGFGALLTTPGLSRPVQYKFESTALSTINSQTDASVKGNFDMSTFDKSLGAYTDYDAGAYLRFGQLKGAAGGATIKPAITFTPAEIDAIINGMTTLSDHGTYTSMNGGEIGLPATSVVDETGTLMSSELPYMMRFTGTSDRRVATVTVLRDSYPNPVDINQASYLRIPMVVRLTDEGAATVNVAPSNNSTVTNVTYTIGNASGGGKTVTSATDVVNARSTFDLETIKISEDVINTMKDGWFYLTAPYGYTWADPKALNSDDVNPITLSSSGGLRYSQNVAVGTYPAGTKWTQITEAGKKGIVTYVADSSRQKLAFKLSDDTRADGTYYDTYAIERFNSIAGTLYIDGLTLLAEDFAPFDKDIMVKITKDVDHDPKITEQEFKVGARKDWVIKLTASQPVPTLVNGRLAYSFDSDGKYTETVADDVDGWHKTSKVTFEENVIASWWEERDTDLTLPDGVKYIKVKIADASGDNEFEFKNNYVLNNTYVAYSLKGAREGYVKVAGNKLTLTDLSLRSGKKANFTIQPWVSIESGFEGDVTMTAGGTGVPYEVAPVVIAKAVSPITIDTEVTDVKIGYQWQKVADFTINETGAGRLLKDKQIVLSIDDAISTDEIAFAPDSVVEKSGNLSFTKPAVTGGSITFMLDRQSNGTAGAIKFSNVYVKIDRTVPESNNHPYKIVAHGEGIAANYAKTYRSYEPLFSTKGIGADYLNVVTAATDKPGVLSNTVRVSIGSDVVLVGRDNPQEIQMDTAAYISAESNSTMVPVRFVSVALGIPEGQIQWDEENRTVTINYTNTTVQMKAGSDQLTINGVTTTMYSPDVPPKKVTVEMKDNRSFLPFRQLGYALGVPVAWDDETRTAIYNAPEDLNTSSSVVADAE